LNSFLETPGFTAKHFSRRFQGRFKREGRMESLFVFIAVIGILTMLLYEGKIFRWDKTKGFPHSRRCKK
jgi:hypothetical protein